MRSIIATYHHGFAGGSKNTSRLLHLLAELDFNIDAFFFELPHYFSYTLSKVGVHQIANNPVNSEVISSERLTNYLLSENMFFQAKDQQEGIVFAANMFPYGSAAFDVKSQLKFFGKNHRLVLHPVGSDMWQIGTFFKSRVKWLLDHQETEVVMTYSRQFAEEIAAYYGLKRTIEILPPLIESYRFYRIGATEKKRRRGLLGFNEDDFIIHHHSSLRKIKCPELVIAIAVKAASRVNRPVSLIMAGPITFENLKKIGFPVKKREGSFLYTSETANLKILWAGLVEDVSFFIQIADMELNCSLHDSFNISLMESMACGLPVVTSDAVGINEHISACSGGYAFKTNISGFDQINNLLKNGQVSASCFDIDSAVDMVTELARCPTSGLGMGHSGAEYVSRTFNAELIINEFKKIIDK